MCPVFHRNMACERDINRRSWWCLICILRAHMEPGNQENYMVSGAWGKLEIYLIWKLLHSTGEILTEFFFFVNVLNDTHRENFVLLYSVQEWLLGCFCVYIINYKFYTLRYQVQMFKKSDSSRQQKWMVAPFSKFYGKICLGFCLNIFLY